jgi:pimeloyl-ACP methyl ester carboxylesterase
MAYDMIPTWPGGSSEVNGVRTHYRRAVADGPSLIALHGLMGSGAVWSPFVRALGGGFDIILPDARGHGDSSVPISGYLYDDHADDVCELIQALDLNKPILIGHSMGGMTAALVASRLKGRIGGVVLVDPTFISPEWQREVYESDVFEQHRRFLEADRGDLIVEARTRNTSRTDEMIEIVTDARLRTNIRALDVLTPPNPDPKALVASITAQILLVRGERGIVSQQLAKELAALNHGVRLETIEDAGHAIPYDEPEKLARLVKLFWAGIAPPE